MGFDYLHFTSGSRVYSTRTKEEVYRFARDQDAEAVALLARCQKVRCGRTWSSKWAAGVRLEPTQALSFLELVEPLVAELPYSEIVHVGNSMGIARAP